MKENSIEEITFVENKIKNTRRVFEEVGCHAFFDEDLCKAIEHILSDYKRVLKENEEVKENCKKCIIRDELDEYVNNSIPIQKVKDKIEELKKKVEELTDEKGYWGGSDLLEQIKVLQELLEENENHIPRID